LYRGAVFTRTRLSQIRLSSTSVMFVHPTQPVKVFDNVSMPLCTC